MYERVPTKEEAAAAGFLPEDYESDPVEVWPDSQQAFDLFCSMRTQWRIGMAGPTGLDYTPLYHKMDRMRLKPEEYEELEGDIRTMEYAALEAMNSKD